jgi:hypothetical protein
MGSGTHQTHFRQLYFKNLRISNGYGTAERLYHYAGTSTSGGLDNDGDAAEAGPSGVTSAGGVDTGGGEGVVGAAAQVGAQTILTPA